MRYTAQFKYIQSLSPPIGWSAHSWRLICVLQCHILECNAYLGTSTTTTITNTITTDGTAAPLVTIDKHLVLEALSAVARVRSSVSSTLASVSEYSRTAVKEFMCVCVSCVTQLEFTQFRLQRRTKHTHTHTVCVCIMRVQVRCTSVNSVSTVLDLVLCLCVEVSRR